MPVWLQEILSKLQDSPWASAAGIVLVIWGVYENWDKIRSKLPTLNPANKTATQIDDTNWSLFTPAELMVPPTQINERSLSTDERQQVFYYLERIRSYAESTKNTEASQNCVDLLNNLFKDFKHPTSTLQNVIDAAKRTK